MIVWLWVRGTRFLMRNDPELRNWAPSRRRPRYSDFRAAGRRGTLPTAMELGKRMSTYFRRDYHPARRGRRRRRWRNLASSPAARAAARWRLPLVRDLVTRREELTRPVPPADLQGRDRPDRAMTIVEAVADKYLRVLTAYDYDPVVAGHNPDTAMTLIGTERTIVAEDENVAALTFAAVDGGELPAWQPGSPRLPSAVRAPSPVLAVR